MIFGDTIAPSGMEIPGRRHEVLLGRGQFSPLARITLDPAMAGRCCHHKCARPRRIAPFCDGYLSPVQKQ
eukprot:1257881-Pyramimonas_sp.AAC.1